MKDFFRMIERNVSSKTYEQKTLGFINLLTDDKISKKESLKDTGNILITYCNYDVYYFPKEKERVGKESLKNH